MTFDASEKFNADSTILRMIELLLTVVPSVFWLLYRCYQLLHTPAEQLADDLRIEVPHNPTICIDLVGRNNVVIHWDVEVREDESLYYVLLINNKEATTITTNSCTLSALKTNKLYQIQVVAVNMLTSFRSQLAPVFIQTLPELSIERGTALESPFALNAPETLALSAVDLTAEQARQIDDFDDLKSHLFYYQNELCKATTDLSEFQDSAKAEFSKLSSLQAFHRREFAEETDNKAKKDNSVKDLEKKKDALTFQKSKLNAQMKNLANAQNLFASNLSEFSKKLDKLVERRHQIEANSESEQKKLSEQSKAIKAGIRKWKSENDDIEMHLRGLVSEKRTLTSQMATLRLLIDLFGAVTPSLVSGSPNTSTTSLALDSFTKDGSLTKNGQETILKVLEIRPEWTADVKKELEQLSAAENNWRNEYRAEIRRFLLIQHSLEIAKTNSDKAYEPLKLTEYQASVEFGGYALALPKTGKNRKVLVAEDGDTSHLSIGALDTQYLERGLNTGEYEQDYDYNNDYVLNSTGFLPPTATFNSASNSPSPVQYANNDYLGIQRLANSMGNTSLGMNLGSGPSNIAALQGPGTSLGSVLENNTLMNPGMRNSSPLATTASLSGMGHLGTNFNSSLDGINTNSLAGINFGDTSHGNGLAANVNMANSVLNNVALSGGAQQPNLGSFGGNFSPELLNSNLAGLGPTLSLSGFSGTVPGNYGVVQQNQNAYPQQSQNSYSQQNQNSYPQPNQKSYGAQPSGQNYSSQSNTQNWYLNFGSLYGEDANLPGPVQQISELQRTPEVPSYETFPDQLQATYSEKTFPDPVYDSTYSGMPNTYTDTFGDRNTFSDARYVDNSYSDNVYPDPAPMAETEGYNSSKKAFPFDDLSYSLLRTPVQELFMPYAPALTTSGLSHSVWSDGAPNSSALSLTPVDSGRLNSGFLVPAGSSGNRLWDRPGTYNQHTRNISGASGSHIWGAQGGVSHDFQPFSTSRNVSLGEAKEEIRED